MNRIAKLFGILALTAVAAPACDNPVDDHDDEHAEAEGVVVLSGSTQLVRVLEGQVTGSLTVAAGATRPGLTVRFIDHDGRTIAPESGTYLDVTSSNSAVATWQQNTAGEFGGQLRGVAAGAATLNFRLMHGAVGSGHADAVISVPVVVTAVASARN